MPPQPPPRIPTLPVLPYRKPTKGRDYWVFDDVLPDADAVRARCLAKDDWVKGYPYTSETWPGLRTMPGLEPDELARVERLVKKATGAKELWVQQAPGGGTLNHNCVQVVGEGESRPRPHTDSRALCRYAAVLYLNPGVGKDCGTAFYRQSLPGGRLGGNIVQAPHNNLVEALGTGSCRATTSRRTCASRTSTTGCSSTTPTWCTARPDTPAPHWRTSG